MATPSAGKIEPEASLPRMFGGHPEPARLPWQWATAQLAAARSYWIATTRPNGQPHSRPVWGVWQDDALYFSTGSLAAQNLAQNPAITVHLESASKTVILEGTAAAAPDASLIEQIISAYEAK